MFAKIWCLIVMGFFGIYLSLNSFNIKLNEFSLTDNILGNYIH